MRPEEYNKISDLAYVTICKIVNNDDNARELAHLVAIKYFLNQEKIIKEKEHNWIITTAKNLAIDNKRTSDKDILTEAGHIENLEDLIADKIITEKEFSAEDILSEYDFLNVKQKKLIQELADNGNKIKKLWKNKKISYKTLQKKLNRLKKEIKAEISKQKGMIATQKIIGARLHENILYFIKQFKKAMLENSIDRITFYIRDCEKPVVLPDFNIREIIDYDIHIVSEGRYCIKVYHLNDKKTFECFITEFEVYNQNSIKIVDFPHKPLKIIQFNNEDASQGFIEKTKSGDKGVIELSADELNKLIETEVKNKKIIFDRNQDE